MLSSSSRKVYREILNTEKHNHSSSNLKLLLPNHSFTMISVPYERLLAAAGHCGEHVKRKVEVFTIYINTLHSHSSVDVDVNEHQQ